MLLERNRESFLRVLFNFKILDGYYFDATMGMYLFNIATIFYFKILDGYYFDATLKFYAIILYMVIISYKINSNKSCLFLYLNFFNRFKLLESLTLYKFKLISRHLLIHYVYKLNIIN